MALTDGFLVWVVVILLLFPTWLLFSEMWSYLAPYQTATLVGSQAGSNLINQIGNTFFYYMPDGMLVLMYFGLIMAVFLSAVYENARPETFPIGLLFLIPLILITFPLSDFVHYFYSQPGFANVVGYYQSIIYISDWGPLFTILVTLAYLLFVMTKKSSSSSIPSGSGIISG